MRYRRGIDVAVAPTIVFPDLRLKGVYHIAEPFLRSTFERIGDAALDGLAARLARASR